MGHSFVSRNEIHNVVLAAQQAAVELAKRAPSSVEMEAYLDGFVTALEVIATGLGVEVLIAPPFSNEPRKWRVTLDIAPASMLDEPTLTEQDEE